MDDDERRYLNSRCVLRRDPVKPGGRGVLSRAKGRAASFVIRSLDRYLDDEEEFLAHLVRLQNKLTVEHDRLVDEVVAIRQSVAEETERIAAATRHLHAAVEERLAVLERRVEATAGRGSKLP